MGEKQGARAKKKEAQMDTECCQKDLLRAVRVLAQIKKRKGAEYK